MTIHSIFLPPSSFPEMADLWLRRVIYGWLLTGKAVAWAVRKQERSSHCLSACDDAPARRPLSTRHRDIYVPKISPILAGSNHSMEKLRRCHFSMCFKNLNKMLETECRLFRLVAEILSLVMLFVCDGSTFRILNLLVSKFTSYRIVAHTHYGKCCHLWHSIPVSWVTRTSHVEQRPSQRKLGKKTQKLSAQVHSKQFYESHLWESFLITHENAGSRVGAIAGKRRLRYSGS